MGFAFDIVEEDLETVLRDNAILIANADGLPISTLAERIYLGWGPEFARIEKAALDSGVELDEQTVGAHAEIRKIFVEQGILVR